MPVASELSPLLGVYNADNVSFWAGQKSYPDPTAILRPAGLIYSVAARTNLGTGTAEQTLASYTIPADTFDQAGRKMRIRAFWTSAANTHSKTCKLYFGTAVISTGAITTASANAFLEMTVTARSTVDTFLVWGVGLGDTTGVVPVTDSSVPTISWSTSTLIKATGQTGTSGAADLVLFDFSVEYMN